MSGFSLPFVILTAVIAFILLLLAADLLYILLHRRRFPSENNTSAADSDILADPYSSPSKELLYFLCWKTHSRIEPAAVAAPAGDGATSPAPPSFDYGDTLKLQYGLHGPSRVLFTIKEEKEESEAEEAKLPKVGKTEKKTLKECLLIAMEDVEETPFATPSASPPFYTPRSSPPRGAEDMAKNLTHMPENDDVDDLSGRKSSGFVCVSVD